jgi:integrase
VDFPSFVADDLAAHRKEQKVRRRSDLRDVWSAEDLVFDDGLGQPLSPWTVSAGFRRLVRDMGVTRIRIHDLRHAHASRLLEAGVHPKVVSERLGHSSIVITMDTYSHVIPTMGRAAANAIDGLFGERGR